MNCKEQLEHKEHLGSFFVRRIFHRIFCDEKLHFQMNFFPSVLAWIVPAKLKDTISSRPATLNMCRDGVNSL